MEIVQAETVVAAVSVETVMEIQEAIVAEAVVSVMGAIVLVAIVVVETVSVVDLVDQEKCIRQLARNVIRNVKCPSSQHKENLFIVGAVFQSIKNINFLSQNH